MDLKESWGNLLTELGLRKPFYSDREAMFDKFKDSSQLSKEADLETQHIVYDPFGSYTNSQVGNAASYVANYGDAVKRWRESSQLPEVDEAIQEITSEAIVFDEDDDVISMNLDEIELSEQIKTKMRDSFDKILYLLDFNEKGEELFRQWYVDGTLTIESVYNNRKPKDGIQRCVLLPPFNVFKFKNEKTSEIKWFINNNPSYNIIRDMENAEKTYFDEQISQITSGVTSPDKKMHFSHLQKAMKSINQLYLLEDSLVIYRLTRSPEKRVFKVDTGNLPKSKAEEYMRSLMTKYRQKKIYNTETGTVEDKNKAISILEDFWFAVNSQGKGTSVEVLQGVSTNFGSFDDIDYFLNKVYKSLNVPVGRRNKEARLTLNPNVDIEKEEMKFFKFIQKLRRRFNNLFVDLLKKDLIAKQVMKIEDWVKIQEKIKFKYANSNEISMFKKMQTLQVRMDAANAASPLIDQQIIDKVWIQQVILGLTDEEAQEINNRIAGSAPIGGNDQLGNMAGGAEAGGGETPGYEEVPGEGAAAPAGGEEVPPAEPAAPKTPSGESAGGAGRFKQKAKESGLSQEIINNLRDGDIITNGKEKLMFEGGLFKKVK